MKLFTTELKAYLVGTTEIRTFRGPRVPGISREDARNWCDENGYGFLVITGEYHQPTSEIDYSHIIYRDIKAN